jgi:hypothetical protein
MFREILERIIYILESQAINLFDGFSHVSLIQFYIIFQYI